MEIHNFYVKGLWRRVGWRFLGLPRPSILFGPLAVDDGNRFWTISAFYLFVYDDAHNN
jgi:hypothetical protein